MSGDDADARRREATDASGLRRIGRRARSFVEELAHRARHWLVARTLPVVYYRFLYGRDHAAARAVGRLVRRWEKRWQLYDAPLPREVWNEDYSDGYWDYMAEAFEAPRYAMIAGYVRVFARGGAVLDVGCGQGILLEHLGVGDVEDYLGFDLSREAVRTARERTGEETAFEVADAPSYRPDAPVDAVVFNEVLYYLEEPILQARRYAEHLRPGGVVITSMYHGSPRALAILRSLRRELTVKAESTTRCRGNTWTCSVFGPE